MSVEQFLRARGTAQHIMGSADRVYCIVANSIWGQAESLEVVAAFDTQAMATAYADASRLASSVRTTERSHGMVRVHRPDSLMWDFNGIDAYWTSGSGVTEANDFNIDWGGIPINPEPPTGPLDPGDFPNLKAEAGS